MKSEPQNKAYTLTQYIQLEELSDIRHEYIQGQLIDMSGTTTLHNSICLNLTMSLLQKLKDTSYHVFMENVKVKIQSEDYYTYPDVVVTKESPSPESYILHQPELIAEVLSDSTRAYDTTDKFIQYKKSDTLQNYLLVEPEIMLVTCFEKAEDNYWNAVVYNQLEDVIVLKKMNIQLSLKDIYQPKITT